MPAHGKARTGEALTAQVGDRIAPGSSVRRRGRPQKGQSESLTQTIVDVAADLFMKDGFRATSMDAIATRTGSSKRTLYARFPSKLHLFKEVMLRFARSRLAILQRFDIGDEALEIFLTRIARDMLAQAVDEGSIAMYRLLVAEGYRYPELKILGHEQLVGPMTQAVTHALQIAIDRGEIADRDPAFLAEQFIEAVCGRDVERIALGYEEAGITDRRLARVDLVVELYLKGIGTSSTDEAASVVRRQKRVSARGGV